MASYRLTCGACGGRRPEHVPSMEGLGVALNEAPLRKAEGDKVCAKFMYWPFVRRRKYEASMGIVVHGRAAERFERGELLSHKHRRLPLTGERLIEGEHKMKVLRMFRDARKRDMAKTGRILYSGVWIDEQGPGTTFRRCLAVGRSANESVKRVFGAGPGAREHGIDFD